MTLRERINESLSHHTHPLIQLIKYGIAGCCALATDVTVFYLLSWKFLPALTADDPFVRLFGLAVSPIDQSAQELHFVINRSLAFLVGNSTAYILNVLFVFQPGRHSRTREIGLFYLASGISLVVGTGLGWAIMHALRVTTTAAYVCNVIAAVSLNYVARKLIIFKG